MFAEPAFEHADGEAGAAFSPAGGECATSTAWAISMQPTVFGNVTVDMTIAREEIFGPVLAAIEFADVEDAIVKANSSIYGLASGV